MTVICTIAVVSGIFFTKADVEGKVISQNEYNYLADFSEDAKKQGFEGEYSRKLVSKKDCVPTK